jgi:hypothetical protein
MWPVFLWGGDREAVIGSNSVSAPTGPFPAKAGPTKKHTAYNPWECSDCRTGFSREALDSLLIFIRNKPRHHKTRLGCRLHAGLAQWAERHGCRESAVGTWMSVRRGPTERDRSEGTLTKEGPNQEHGLFGYFFGCWKNPP